MSDVEKELIQVAAVAINMLETKYCMHNNDIWTGILEELHNSRVKFGDQTHRSNFEWLSILTEEVGEVAKALNDEQLDKESANDR